MRRLGRDPRVLGWLGDLAFRLVAATCRIRVHGGEGLRSPGQCSTGHIYALWHGRLLLGALAHRGRGTVVLVSQHADGEVMARILVRHGYRPVRGSSTRGGGEALREMTALAQFGSREFAVTPDGPRGPRHRAQVGVVLLASRTGCPIVPSSASARSGRFFDSWDRFLLPRPFTRVEVVYGEPLPVPVGLDERGIEEWRQRVETALNEVEAEADRLAGWRA